MIASHHNLTPRPSSPALYHGRPNSGVNLIENGLQQRQSARTAKSHRVVAASETLDQALSDCEPSSSRFGALASPGPVSRVHSVPPHQAATENARPGNLSIKHSPPADSSCLVALKPASPTLEGFPEGISTAKPTPGLSLRACTPLLMDLPPANSSEAHSLGDLTNAGSSSTAYPHEKAPFVANVMQSLNQVHWRLRKSIKLSTRFRLCNEMKLTLLVLVWYACSALTNTMKKSLLSIFGYPVTITLFQFLGVMVLSLMGHNLKLFRVQPMSWHVVRLCLPQAGFQMIGHVLTSVAMQKASVAFVHTVKSLSPLFTVALNRALLGKRYSVPVYLSLVPLVTGVMLACTKGKQSIAVTGSGFLLTVSSTIVFVFQNIFTKQFLFGGEERRAASSTSANTYKSWLPPPVSNIKAVEDVTAKSKAGLPHSKSATKVDKYSILLYSSMFAVVLLIPGWCTSDLYRLMNAQQPVRMDRYLLMLLVSQGFGHFLQSVIAYTILAQVSTVTYSVASLLKRIVIIVFAIIWFGDVVSGQQAFGIALAFFGLYLYQRFSSSVASG